MGTENQRPGQEKKERKGGKPQTKCAKKLGRTALRQKKGATAKGKKKKKHTKKEHHKGNLTGRIEKGKKKNNLLRGKPGLPTASSHGGKEKPTQTPGKEGVQSLLFNQTVGEKRGCSQHNQHQGVILTKKTDVREPAKTLHGSQTSTCRPQKPADDQSRKTRNTWKAPRLAPRWPRKNTGTERGKSNGSTRKTGNRKSLVRKAGGASILRRTAVENGHTRGKG